MKHLFIFISYLLLTSCTLSTESESNISQQNESQKNVKPEPHNANPASLLLKNKLNEVNSLIGLSCKNTSQCKVIGIGVSPCGGFSSYSVYSETTTQVTRLKENVQQFNQIIRAQNSKNKVVGICRHIEPPKAICSENQCVASTNKLLL